MPAPAGGTVSFAGTVPSGGETVTIETQDGYSVTLLHLGSIGVKRNAAVSEGDSARADVEHSALISYIDRAVKRGALHRNSGARKKSRAARIRTGA